MLVIMKAFIAAGIFLIFISVAGLAEVSGNLSTVTPAPTTGFFGYTVGQCNTTAQCSGFECYRDWDTDAGSNYVGWCNATSLGSCYANTSSTDGTPRPYASSTVFCSGAYTHTCNSNGSWVRDSCSNGCINATLCNTTTTSSSSSSSSSSSGGSTTTTTTTGIPGVIVITETPGDFNITQGESVTKSLVIKNNGTTNVLNTALELSISSGWYSVSPAVIDRITVSQSKTFTITFSIPADADVKEYNITATAGNVTYTDTKAFRMKVLPSEETVQTQIIPLYDDFEAALPSLEGNLTALEAAGMNTTELAGILEEIKDKMEIAKQQIDAGQYFEAKQTLDEIKALVDEFNSKLVKVETTTPIPLETIAIAGGVVAAVALAVYMFWPAGAKAAAAGYVPGKGWSPKKQYLYIAISLFPYRRGDG